MVTATLTFFQLLYVILYAMNWFSNMGFLNVGTPMLNANTVGFSFGNSSACVFYWSNTAEFTIYNLNGISYDLYSHIILFRTYYGIYRHIVMYEEGI